MGFFSQLRAAACTMMLGAVWATPSYSVAQNSLPNLTTLLGFEIGQPCTAMSNAYSAVGQLPPGQPYTSCHPWSTEYEATIFDLPGTLPGRKRAVLILQFQPGGVLWGATSNSEWEAGKGPLAEESIKALYDRFGPPPLIDDWRNDPVFKLRSLRNGPNHLSGLRMAWGSLGAHWNGSKNVSPPKYDCDNVMQGTEAVRCAMEEANSQRQAWESHLAGLRGVLTTADLTIMHGRITHLSVSMSHPEVARIAAADKERQSKKLFEALDRASRHKSRDSMPRF
jgi:hypothetical protein